MGQGSGDETGVYQSLWPLRPQAKKIAGFIPFFRTETLMAGGSTA
jgi:hypothetical protein